MKIKFFVVLLGTISILINACTMQGTTPVFPLAAQENPEVSLNFLLPGNGTIFVLNDAIPIHLDAFVSRSTSATAISSYVFLANGVSVEPSPSVGGDEFYTIWAPPSAGEYYIQAKVILQDGSSAISQPHRICVMPRYSWIDNDGVGGYVGPCQLPTQIPPPYTSSNLTLSAVEAPNPTWFSDTCQSYPTATFIVTVDDPQDQVAFVRVVLSNVRNILYHYHFLNWVTTRAGNQKEYRGTIQINQDLFSATSSNQIIFWTLDPLGRNGYPVDTVRDGQPVGQLRGVISVQHFECTQSPRGTAQPLESFATNTPTPNDLIANAQAYPSPIYYGQTCPTLSTVSFRAALKLSKGTTPDQIQAFAHVAINGAGGSAAGNLLIPLMSNGTWDAASGGQVFLGSVSLTHSYKDADNQFDPASLGGSSGSLHWYMTLTGSDSSGKSVELARSSDQTINLAPCPTYAKPTSKPAQPSSGSSCSLSDATCSLTKSKFDPATCSCVP